MFLDELEVRRVGQTSGGANKFDMQAMSEGVAVLGAHPVITRLFTQLLHVLPVEPLGVVGLGRLRLGRLGLELRSLLTVRSVGGRLFGLFGHVFSHFFSSPSLVPKTGIG